MGDDEFKLRDDLAQKQATEWSKKGLEEELRKAAVIKKREDEETQLRLKAKKALKAKAEAERLAERANKLMAKDIAKTAILA